MIYKEELDRARSRAGQIKDFLKSLKKKNTSAVDVRFHQNHDQVFREIDCLECANCCKTTSPLFSGRDISRLSKALKMSERSFFDQYLKTDEDGDTVLQTAPCPFLGHGNKCIVYKDRPRACREYPHTNRKKMTQILTLTYKNAMICPAVARIVGRIQDQMG